MFSTFPALLDFSQIAVTFLRITVGLFFLLFGLRLTLVAWSIKEKNFAVRFVGVLYGLAKLLTGVFLTLGAYTQIAAIVGAILSSLTFFQGFSSFNFKSAQQVQLLLFVLCLAFLFLGPGLFSIDIPL
jgi:hypothetical protein